jgi:hypothetical protein
MKAYKGVDANIQVFLRKVLVGDLSASSLGRFNPGEICPCFFTNYLPSHEGVFCSLCIHPRFLDTGIIS